MNSPTQIASEIMKHKVEIVNEVHLKERRNINVIADDLIRTNSKIHAHKMDWENELEFLKMKVPLSNRYKWFDNRISELTSALKILGEHK